MINRKSLCVDDVVGVDDEHGIIVFLQSVSVVSSTPLLETGVCQLDEHVILTA